MKYFMTDNQVIHEEEKLQDGVWVRMISPTQEECEEIADVLNVDIDDIKAALDEEESSRIELQDGYTLILVDVPTTEIRHDKQSYTTIPLGIILTQDVIVTVCTEDTPVLKNFVINRVKEFSTKKRLRFVYQILYRTATIYQTNLRIIDKRRTEIEERIGQHTEDVDLIDLHELESTLVYFATSLRANGVVLDRLTRYKRLEQYPEDTELLGDVIVENQQAIEMTSIYRDIINGTRELMSSVIDNRLNNYSYLIRSVVNYINQHLSSELSLATLASEFGKNASYLSSEFKKEVGDTLTTYINKHRILASLRYFNTTDMSVAEVSNAVGYTDMGYFSRLFRKYVGQSPREYKKMLDK